jgi:hypothetical protein
VIEIKFEEHIHEKDIVNLIMIFQKHNLKKHDFVLIQHGLKKYNWLEYSVLEDVMYYLYSYIFKPASIGNQVGGNSFVTKSF